MIAQLHNVQIKISAQFLRIPKFLNNKLQIFHGDGDGWRDCPQTQRPRRRLSLDIEEEAGVCGFDLNPPAVGGKQKFVIAEFDSFYLQI